MKARVPKQVGGAGNTNTMLRKAKKMQDEITALQADIEQREFTVTSGGGAVEVVAIGNKTLKSLTIDKDAAKDAIENDDMEMLQDLIISAVNEAIDKIENVTEAEMSKITGGVALPGLF